MSAAAGLMDEALQHSLATSEEDAEFEEDDMADDLMAENENAVAANHQLQNGLTANHEEEDSDDDDLSTEHAMLTDADGEDEEMADSPLNLEEEESEDEEDEDGEGVGAVKIQPGLLEDEEEVMTGTDDDDDESVASVEEEEDDDDDESKDSSDAEVEAEWKSAGEEEEELANPNRCMYVPSKFELEGLPSVRFANSTLDFVNKMKRMTPARSLRCIYPAQSVETMVGESLVVKD
jgi:histone acetyltransferase SAS3